MGKEHCIIHQTKLLKDNGLIIITKPYTPFKMITQLHKESEKSDQDMKQEVKYQVEMSTVDITKVVCNSLHQITITADKFMFRPQG